MESLPGKMVLWIKKIMVNKIAQAAAGNAPIQTRLQRRNLKLMRDLKNNSSSESPNERKPPGYIRSIRAEEIRKSTQQRFGSLEHQLAVVRATSPIHPC